MEGIAQRIFRGALTDEMIGSLGFSSECPGVLRGDIVKTGFSGLTESASECPKC